MEKIETTMTLPCAYMPPIEWFSLLRKGAEVEVCDTFQKQTYRNRCHIATPNGVQALTIPIRHGLSTAGADTLISEQGAWRHLHLQALRSSYQATPYYDYYKDELEAFYEPGLYPTLYGFNLAIIRWMAEQMGIGDEIRLSTTFRPEALADIHPKHASTYHTRPYYQVFAQRTGFVPGLSGIDLLMNMGPESIFHL